MKIEEAVKTLKSIQDLDWHSAEAVDVAVDFIEKVLTENTHPTLNTTLVEVVSDLDKCKLALKELKDKYEPDKQKSY